MRLLSICKKIQLQVNKYQLLYLGRRLCSAEAVRNNEENNWDTNSSRADADLSSQLKHIKHIFDLRDPGQYFINARAIKRKFIFHYGPTNSGKTYHALEAFFNAERGIYCGPLRMLANEIYCKAVERNIQCDMITGEERIYAVSEEAPSNHLASTVEMSPFQKHYDVAVIDEIEMLRDPARGYAWTRALLGITADEIHLCGEEATLDLLKRLLKNTHDTLEVKAYQRLTPLKILNTSVKDLRNLQKGDCLVTFSQRKLYDFREKIQALTSLKCAVVYGALPSNERLKQADKFNSGESDVLVATDAIGMGLNLNINRLIFSGLSKFDGIQTQDLEPSHVKQIAGRAGRYNSKYRVGKVTTLNSSDYKSFRHSMNEPITPIKKAGILPTYEQLLMISSALPGKSLFELLEVFEILMLLDKNYFLCDRKIDEMKKVSVALKNIPLTFEEVFTFSLAPVKTRSPFVLRLTQIFADHLAKSNLVTIDMVKKMIFWPPQRKLFHLRQLIRLEEIHEVLDLYLWLSFKFEDNFNDVEEVKALQDTLSKIISQTVDSNFQKDRTWNRNWKKHRK